MRPTAPPAHAVRAARIAIPALLAATATVRLVVPSARAATITVCPSGCSHATLGAAVQAAADGDVIEVHAGTYPAGLVVTKPITIRGAGPEQTILTSGGRGAVLALRNTSGRTTVEHLTLTGGVGYEIDRLRYGAGLYVGGHTATARDIVVRDNASPRDGGGVYVDFGELTLIDSIVRNNSAVNAGAGVFVNDGGTMVMSGGEIAANTVRNPEDTDGDDETNARGAGLMVEDRATVTGTVIRDNVATAQGGGVYCLARCRLTLSGVTVRGNKANRGAGVFNAAVLTIERSTIAANTTTGQGGGIFNFNTLTVDDSEIIDNEAEQQGGGIANLSGFSAQQVGLMTIARTTFSGNRTKIDGGGIWQGVDVDNPPQYPESTVDRSTLTANVALAGAGAYLDAGRLDVTDSTIADNVSRAGAGVATTVDNALRVGGSILANDAHGDNCDGRIASTGSNLDSDGTCAFQNRGDITSSRVELGPLADNGGPTRTRAIGANSAAIDAGNPGRCAQRPFDQRGAARPVDGDGDGTKVCDIGAFEFGAEIPGTATPTPTRTPTGPPTTPSPRTATPSPTATQAPPDVTPSPTATFVDGDTPTPAPTTPTPGGGRAFMPYAAR